MKRILAVVAILALLLPCVLATAIELDTLSFDELVELHKETFLKIVTHPDYKQVDVPPGKYEVGVHIPVGEYTITTNDSYTSIVINDYKEAHVFKKGEVVGRLVLNKGDIVEISNGTIVFAPFVGLGF